MLVVQLVIKQVI